MNLYCVGCIYNDYIFENRSVYQINKAICFLTYYPFLDYFFQFSKVVLGLNFYF